MKKHLILLVCLCLIACSGKEEDSNSGKEEDSNDLTFLEANDNVGFVTETAGSGLDYYIFFYDDTVFMKYYSEDDWCNYFEEGENIFASTTVNVEILVNSPETLRIGFSETYNGPETYTFSLDESGNNLTFQINTYPPEPYIRTNVSNSSLETNGCGSGGWD